MCNLSTPFVTTLLAGFFFFSHHYPAATCTVKDVNVIPQMSVREDDMFAQDEAKKLRAVSTLFAC